jgi:hypothetical protein
MRPVSAPCVSLGLLVLGALTRVRSYAGASRAWDFLPITALCVTLSPADSSTSPSTSLNIDPPIAYLRTRRDRALGQQRADSTNRGVLVTGRERCLHVEWPPVLKIPVPRRCGRNKRTRLSGLRKAGSAFSYLFLCPRSYVLSSTSRTLGWTVLGRKPASFTGFARKFARKWSILSGVLVAHFLSIRNGGGCRKLLERE